MRVGRFAVVALVATSCTRGDPPAPERHTGSIVVRAVEAKPSAASEKRASGERAPGSIEDNLPFLPTGKRAASIAWRNWVYTDVGSKRTRYGYLRLGAVVDVRGPAIVNDGCESGWYRVNPRGFVCVGLGATLDLSNPASVASARRATRGQGLPYAYALSNDVSPLLYFRLPSLDEMKDSEQDDVLGRGAVLRERIKAQGLEAVFPLGAPPEFLANGAKLPKPLGVKQPLRFVYHAGPAKPDSGFALAETFEWQGRPFGLTTELDIIALDRTKPVKPSDFRGVALGEGDDLPVGFSMPRGAERYERVGHQTLPKGTLGWREAVLLTGKELPGAVLEAKDGTFVSKPTTRVVEKRTSFPSFATGDRKWIDVSVKDQTLVAYVGRRAVYVTLVSTGRSGMADPEKTDATVRGSFMIYQKEVSSTMDGEEDRAADSFDLHDVPFVQYFHKGYALHGTYWHDDFGKARSHGCVNLAPADAAWLFEWTDPSVPSDWHGVINKDRGTVVYIHV